MSTTHTPVLSRDRTVLLILCALAFGLRFYRLDGQSLWIDEYLMIQRASLGEPFRWADWFVNPQGPLPALLLRLATSLFGNSEAALRLPSALAGTATVPLVFLLSRRLASASAWPAAALAAFSPILVWYSQEARHYALAILAAAWSAGAFLKLLEERPGRAAWISYSLSLLVGLLSNLTMVFMAAAQGATLLFWRRDRLKPWIVSILPVMLALLPWFWIAVTQNLNLDHVAQSGPIPVEERLRGESTFSWLGLPYTAYIFFAGYSLGPTLTELHARPEIGVVLPHLPLILLLALGIGVLLAAGFARLKSDPLKPGFILLAVAIPLAAVTVLALRNAKVFNPRYAIIALPLLLAVAGIGFEVLRRKSRAVAAAMAALVVVPMLVSLNNYFHDGRYAREDMRAAARVLSGEASADDVILGQGAPQVLRWYYSGPAPFEVVYEYWVRDVDDLQRRAHDWAAGKSRVWLLISRPWLQDPEYRLRKILDADFGPGVERRFDGVVLLEYDVSKAGRD